MGWISQNSTNSDFQKTLRDIFLNKDFKKGF